MNSVKLNVSWLAVLRSDAGRRRGRSAVGCSKSNAWGRDVTERENREGSIEMLHRMIIYVREEALRLRVMDVALLLEHAENAMTAFASAALNGLAPSVVDANRVEH